MTGSTPARHFEALYRRHADPWELATSGYEDRKYRATVAALGERRFRNGLEVGCSIGTLTERLAGRCDALLGIDFIEQPLREARERCANLPHVRFELRAVPAQWPPGSFDLIVLSEVLYFLSPADLNEVARRCATGAEPDRTVSMVNWRRPNDGTMPGDAAAEMLLGLLPASWKRIAVALNDDYRIDMAVAE
jgi:2-polyprenyl-3-methyl-5-hydroxy-6-metoxy-1,4-benzoquinol methylase